MDAPPTLSQYETASLLGVTRAAVQACERRALAKIRAEIDRQAEAAGVSQREWVWGDDS